LETIMAYLLSSERPALAAAQFNPVSRVFAWLAKARATRAQRVALENLLEFDASLLDDLGINRGDVISALQNPRSGQALAARRAQSSRNWLNP
jgi:uncharacterized protein YjiS (DUF1127 family)